MGTPLEDWEASLRPQPPNGEDMNARLWFIETVLLRLICLLSKQQWKSLADWMTAHDEHR